MPSLLLEPNKSGKICSAKTRHLPHASPAELRLFSFHISPSPLFTERQHHPLTAQQHHQNLLLRLRHPCRRLFLKAPTRKGRIPLPRSGENSRLPRLGTWLRGSGPDSAPTLATNETPPVSCGHVRIPRYESVRGNLWLWLLRPLRTAPLECLLASKYLDGCRIFRLWN